MNCTLNVNLELKPQHEFGQIGFPSCCWQPWIQKQKPISASYAAISNQSARSYLKQTRTARRQRWEARNIFIFVILVFYSAYLYFGYSVCFYFRWNSVDSSVSSWTKRWTLVLEMSATFWRQRGNGAVEVSFESRTAQMSALFHIFTCAFCLV